jgi:hypothetical protein
VVLKQIKAFFSNYQRVRGVKFEILGHHGPDRAVNAVICLLERIIIFLFLIVLELRRR